MKRFTKNIKYTDGCWEWEGDIANSGYGKFTLGKGSISAHRFAYDLYIGEVPRNKLVLHSCDNKICVNPAHLFLGTHKDNTTDMINKKRDSFIGSKSHFAILNEEKVKELRQFRKEGMLVRELAEYYGVAQRTVQAALYGQNWKHVE